MKTIRKEVIGGKTYSLLSDGSYDPPLPPEEVDKREQRLPEFRKELRNGQVARGETDATYVAGMPHFSEVFGEDYANEVRAKWDEMGVPYTSQTNYCPHLAEYQGDPNAIVDGRGAAKKRLERLQAPVLEDPFAKAPKLAPELIVENAQNFAKENPDEARKMDARDMTDHMVEKHAPKL